MTGTEKETKLITIKTINMRKKPEPKFKKGDSVYNTISRNIERINSEPQWNGFTYMYSFEETDMRSGEMYLRISTEEKAKFKGPY